MSATTNPTEFIEHIILFKLKPNVDPSAATAMVNNLNSLASIDTVLHLTAGPLLRFRSSSMAFTHVLHSRHASKADLDYYSTHPAHLAVIKAVHPIIEDAMAIDWVHSAGTVAISSSSAMRVTFLKLREDLEEKDKNEVLGVIRGIKEKFPDIEALSVGENISPARAKGFSIAWVAMFKGINQLEGFESEWEAGMANEQKDLLKDKVDDEAVVFNYVIP